ncbi:MAG: hypothetical protein ACON4B_03605 [Flavobacteriaceae bacterium]
MTQFKTAITKKIWGRWASLMLVICFGAWCGVMNQPTRHSDHYSHMVPQKNKTLKPVVIQVNTILNPTKYNLRFYANIVQWDSTDVFGKILLNIKTDTLTPPFVVDYITGENISEHKIESINPIYRISNNNLLLIDSLGIYKFRSQKFDWVLMQYSPKIHFETMIETLQPRLVIADGSNYKSLINRWKKTCKSKGVKFYDTATSGAFIYPLK